MQEKEFLKELKRHGKENDIPNISETNARFLRDLIKITNSKFVLELGMANGYSTINFAFELKNLKRKGKITSIEFSPKSYNDALGNFKKASLEDFINPILGNALDEIPKLKDESFDFIFIDAMKKRSLDFFKLSFPKLKKGGVMIIDDVIKFRNKMPELEPYLKENSITYNILPIDLDDGVMMIIKDI
ncbi:hypothetical protein CSB07_00665 [Candidatus Gracilibacteria bacterium]|nr:MAG: hypothetical protein CSB07_00665 [Candidatus Gracilibacteria bacterium]